jgi:hypothetical protein
MPQKFVHPCGPQSQPYFEFRGLPDLTSRRSERPRGIAL